MLLDLTNVKAEEFSIVPVGEYVCNITAAEVKETKTGSGQYIKTEFTVVDGEQKGRKIFSQFNIKNQNPEAVAIGLKQLKTMLVKANHPNPEKVKLDEITGLTVGVKTKITKSDEYGDKAEVHYFFSPQTKAADSDLGKPPF